MRIGFVGNHHLSCYVDNNYIIPDLSSSNLVSVPAIIYDIYAYGGESSKKGMKDNYPNFTDPIIMQCISCPQNKILNRWRGPRSGRGWFLAIFAHFMRFSVLGTCSVLGRTNGEICLEPATLKACARVEYAQ